jgi:VWFA-related protein
MKPKAFEDGVVTRRALLAASLVAAAPILRGQNAQGWPRDPASGPPAQPGQVAPKPDTPASNSAWPTFSTDVKVVNVLATVRAKDGEIIDDLKQADFELLEEDRPQVIRYFSRQSDLPLTLGLIVDTSWSQRTVLNKEKDASRQFLGQILREKQDKAFLIHFDRETELLQDLTSSRHDLEAAIDMLKVPDRPTDRVSDSDSGRNGGSGGGGGWPEGGGWPGSGGGRRGGGGFPGGGHGGEGRRGDGGSRSVGGTTLYDAVLLSSEDILSKQSGRKATFLLTDGVDRHSKTSLSSAIAAAQRSDCLVYSILFVGEEGHGGAFGGGGYERRGGGNEDRPDGKAVLTRIAKETGGSFFEVSKKLSLEEIYNRIEKELRNQYSIGYTSDKPGSAGEFRRITLKTNRKDAVVQSREGYYLRS